MAVSRGDIRNPFDRRRHGKHGRRIESLELACETHKGGEYSHVYSLEFDNGILGHRTIRAAERYIILFSPFLFRNDCTRPRLVLEIHNLSEVNSRLHPRTEFDRAIFSNYSKIIICGENLSRNFNRFFLRFFYFSLEERGEEEEGLVFRIDRFRTVGRDRGSLAWKAINAKSISLPTILTPTLRYLKKKIKKSKIEHPLEIKIKNSRAGG